MITLLSTPSSAAEVCYIRCVATRKTSKYVGYWVWETLFPSIYTPIYFLCLVPVETLGGLWCLSLAVNRWKVESTLDSSLIPHFHRAVRHSLVRFGMLVCAPFLFFSVVGQWHRWSYSTSVTQRNPLIGRQKNQCVTVVIISLMFDTLSNSFHIIYKLIWVAFFLYMWINWLVTDIWCKFHVKCPINNIFTKKNTDF